MYQATNLYMHKLAYSSLTRLEAGEGDMSQFNKWQDEMRHRDATKKAAEVERKHLVINYYKVLKLMDTISYCYCIAVTGWPAEL